MQRYFLFLLALTLSTTNVTAKSLNEYPPATFEGFIGDYQYDGLRVSKGMSEELERFCRTFFAVFVTTAAVEMRYSLDNDRPVMTLAMADGTLPLSQVEPAGEGAPVFVSEDLPTGTLCAGPEETYCVRKLSAPIYLKQFEGEGTIPTIRAQFRVQQSALEDMAIPTQPVCIGYFVKR